MDEEREASLDPLTVRQDPTTTTTSTTTTTTTTATPTSATTTASSLCGLCSKVKWLYTCPRCNVHYCSVQCYSSSAHSQCSELFYRDCFMTGLKDLQTDSETKTKMMKLLQRMNEEEEGKEEDDANDNDDDEGCDAVREADDRLASIDLNADDVDIWNQLSESHRRHFVEMLRDGRMAELVPVWQPWWHGVQLVTDLTSPHSPRQRVPRLVPGLKSVSRLLSTSRPSDSLPYTVLSAVYLYCYTARLYNGEHASLLTTESSYLLTEVLLANTVPPSHCEDVSSLIACCLVSVSRQPYFVSRQFSLNVIRDLIVIVSKSLTAAALSDCHSNVKRARKDCLKESTQRHQGRGERGRERGRGRVWNGNYDNSKTSVTVSDEASRLRLGRSDKCCDSENVQETTEDNLTVQSNTTSNSQTTTQSNQSDRASAQDEHRTACFRLQKKLEFLISWTLENQQVLSDLLPLLECELSALSSDLDCHTADKKVMEELLSEKNDLREHKPAVNKPLIEVIQTDL